MVVKTSYSGGVDSFGLIAVAIVTVVAGQYFHPAIDVFAREFTTAEELQDFMASATMIGFSVSMTLLYGLLLLSSKDTIVKKLPWLPSAAKVFQPTYNILQATFNTWHAFAAFSCAFENGYSFWGNVNPQWNPTMGMLYWLYYLNKIADCTDTIFIKLNGKKSMSKLHCMLHGGQIWLSYFVLRICPMGDCWGPQCINSAIHAAMYSWYLLSASKIPTLTHFAKLVKPCLTAMQMIQFLVLMVHNAQTIQYGSVPVELGVGSFIWMVFLFAMFANFWCHTYTFKGTGKIGV
ncbi:of very long chain fatty acids protein 7 [Seminavis robusta]|uniref:Elongation of fatty acids protein n=1 Tax=Seminavis robusta TaxID=568900 RepID=A0A9N8DVN3_9STRA|nr:of very long chain fatty acids protein 7 [Seminavis robusta]|eukprot:Sro407_g136500.1 of very long chain fatty acids protein 7 (291) ;mRNA; r:419-1291